MDKLNIVLEQLQKENYNAIIKTEVIGEEEWSEIMWTDESGGECYIYQDNVSIENDKIAWFQSSNQDRHLLKIYGNGFSFDWIPQTHNPIFGCYCLLLEWYKEHLIFIYQEKHGIYICTVKNKKVKYFYFHGEEIERKGNLISYETYTNKLPGMVRLIQLPDLIELEPIPVTEAEKRGLLPQGLNKPGNFLAENWQADL